MSAVDASVLFEIFTASFSQDPNVRISAELELRKYEPREGLLPTLLQLISPQAVSSSAVVRLAAAIYLKNRVSTSWRTPTPPSAHTHFVRTTPYTAIPPSDRLALKLNILPLLAALAQDPAGVPVKQQMEVVLAKVIEADYPENWPGLGDEVMALLSKGEGEVDAGLRAIVLVIRNLRYSRAEADSGNLAALIGHIFPTLLSLAQRILAQNPTDAVSLAQQGNFLHLLLKAYKNSIQSSLAPSLQAPDSIIPWGTLFLSIVQRAIPIELLPADKDAREKHSWSRAKKWAMYTLNRLFSRYGNPGQLPTNMKAAYLPFAQNFVAQLAPEIMRSYLGIVERVVSGEWAASKTKHHMLSFFEECIKPISTWALLKPHVQTLIEKFVFPLICLTEDEIELYTDDPPEFARTHFGDFIEDSYNNPCATSLTFVAALVELRKKTCLMPILNFIQDISVKYPAETTPREKDGALRMLVSMASVATKSKKLAPMMEGFFQSNVLPEFKSPHGFLRYRACNVVERFESCDMDWGVPENVQVMARAIMEAVTDPDLPVRIQAAIALPEIARYEHVRAFMVPNIGRIMQELLKLGDEVDLDALTTTTRELVSEFSNEVLPFAVELTQSLCSSYSRLVGETLEGREKESGDGYDDSYEDEKTMVCMSILKTLDGLVSSLDGSPVALDQVESIIAPVLEFTVRNNLVELFDEVFEILDSLSFFQKKISPCMWPLFEATYHSFKNGALDYFSEMFGCIDNFITFGHGTIATNPEYRHMLIDMFTIVMTSPALGADDRVTACKLGEGILLHLRGQIDDAIAPIITRAMTCVLSPSDNDDFVVTSMLYLHSLELVITSFYYSPALSLAVLEAHSWTAPFFTAWFKNLAKYSRVHDIRLGIGAICEILEFLAGSGGIGASPLLVQGSSQFVVAALSLFAAFPGAMLAKKTLEQDIADGSDDEGEDLEDDLDNFDDEDGDAEEGDVLDANNDYLEMLNNSQRANFGEGSDTSSTWSEEVLWASPIDSVDVYARFTATMTALEVSNPGLFQLATQPLIPEQRSQLEAIASQALQGGEADLTPVSAPTVV